jgi:formamidopyrimidine-DNA glycosylase
MPELAEVETSRLSLLSALSGVRVLSIMPSSKSKIAPTDYDEIVFECSLKDLEDALVGKCVKSINRKGKQLWFDMEGKGPAVLFHFGMTGSFAIKGSPVPSYKSFKISETWPPRFTKLEMSFSNGSQVAFCDARRLGRVRLRHNPLTSPPISLLALDPYTEPFDLEYVSAGLSATSKPIKALLLEQDGLFSGIGNWLADEILFQSGIHPKSSSNTILPFAVKKLMEKTKAIISCAVECQSSGNDMPDDWLFHHRWNKGKSKKCTLSDGSGIVFETVGGRTSAVVPSVQRIGGPRDSKDVIVLCSQQTNKSCVKKGDNRNVRGLHEDAASAEKSVETTKGGNRKRKATDSIAATKLKNLRKSRNK